MPSAPGWRRCWPLVPLAAEHSLGVAVASYDGKVFLGLNADERATDVATLAHGIETSMAELVELGATGQALAALS